MAKEARYHLITLRRVWDLGDRTLDPRERAPDALLERHARAFPETPGNAEIGATRSAERRLIEDVFETVDDLGFVVITTEEWDMMRSRPGWTSAGVRRHTQGGERLLDLAAYGLSPAALKASGAAWRPAPTLGPTVEQAMHTLRQMAVEQGLEPGPISPEIADLAPTRSRHRRPPRSVNVDR